MYRQTGNVTDVLAVNCFRGLYSDRQTDSRPLYSCLHTIFSSIDFVVLLLFIETLLVKISKQYHTCKFYFLTVNIFICFDAFVLLDLLTRMFWPCEPELGVKDIFAGILTLLSLFLSENAHRDLFTNASVKLIHVKITYSIRQNEVNVSFCTTHILCSVV